MWPRFIVRRAAVSGDLLWRSPDAVRCVVSTTLPVERKDAFEFPTVKDFAPRFSANPKLQFKIISYNILAQSHIFLNEIQTCPREVLEWEFRRRAIKQDIQFWDADLLCLQEVERIVFEEELEPWLMENGFEGIYFCKEPETVEGVEMGVALIYKTSSFVRISNISSQFKEYVEPFGHGMFFQKLFQVKDGFAMALLHHRASNREILVAGVQLYGDPNWPDVRIAQMHVLCETLQTFLKRQMRPIDTPVIVLGDFASFWKKWSTDNHDKWVEGRSIMSGVYWLLIKGQLTNDHCHHPHIRNHHGTIRKTSIKKLVFNSSKFLFESAYFRAHGAEPLVTKCTTHFKDAADYIFYTPDTLDTISTLRMPYKSNPLLLPRQLKFLPMPNAHYPSTHLPIGATLTLSQL